MEQKWLSGWGGGGSGCAEQSRMGSRKTDDSECETIGVDEAAFGMAMPAEMMAGRQSPACRTWRVKMVDY